MALELVYGVLGGCVVSRPGGPTARVGVAAATASRWDLLATSKVDVPQMRDAPRTMPDGPLSLSLLQPPRVDVPAKMLATRAQCPKALCR